MGIVNSERREAARGSGDAENRLSRWSRCSLRLHVPI